MGDPVDGGDLHADEVELLRAEVAELRRREEALLAHLDAMAGPDPDAASSDDELPG